MYLKNQFLRGFEKIPSINLMQFATFGDNNVVMTPKVGTRSIRDSLLLFHGIDISDKEKAWNYIRYISRARFMSTMNHQKTLLVLRDPFDRLYSCWKQKISEQRDGGYFFYYFQYFPFFRPGMNFLSFLEIISKMPIPLYEKHFIPICYGLDINCLNVQLCILNDLNCRLSSITGLNELPVSNKTRNFNLDLSAERFFFEKHLSPKYHNDYRLIGKLSGI